MLCVVFVCRVCVLCPLRLAGQEVKHTEGSFAELRAKGAPDEGPAYADGDAASQVCAGRLACMALPQTRMLATGGPLHARGQPSV